MIKLKLNELLNATDALQTLSKKSLQARPAFQVVRLLKAADKEIQEFNDIRVKVVNQYGDKDENGELITDENGNCHIAPEHINEFNKELNDLLNTEIEINANMLSLSDLEELEFTPSDLALLEPFIEE